MFTDRWKQVNRADPRGGQFPQASSSLLEPASDAPCGGGEGVLRRHSHGLEQFFGHIRGQGGLNLLDLSGASQANISFITNLGHKLYSENLLETLDLVFSPGDFYTNQEDPERQRAFLQQNFQFPESHLPFDGALVWDVLEFIARPLLKPVLERFYEILRPGGYLLAMFHAEERADIPTWSYRIQDAGTLLLASRGRRQPAQYFNNRAVEKLFQDFESVKFFLTRDSLREVIVKR